MGGGRGCACGLGGIAQGGVGLELEFDADVPAQRRGAEGGTVPKLGSSVGGRGGARWGVAALTAVAMASFFVCLPGAMAEGMQEGVRQGRVRGLGVAGDESKWSEESLVDRVGISEERDSEMRKLVEMENVLQAEMRVVDTLRHVMEARGRGSLIATTPERHEKRAAGDRCRDLEMLPEEEACQVARESCKPPNGLFNYLEISYCTMSSLQWVSGLLLLVWISVLFMWITSMVDFLVPSLATMAQACGFKESVAGVTFLALGNGSSDIFSMCAATVSGPRGMELTLGEIFGNGMFVFSFISGMIAIVAPFTVDPMEHMRDCVSYLASITAVALIMHDGIITFFEGVVLLLIYAVYVTAVIHFDTIRSLLGLPSPKGETVIDTTSDEQASLLSSDRYAVYAGRVDPRDHTHMQQLADFLHPIPADFEYLTNGEKIMEVAKIPVVLLLKLTVPVVNRGMHNSGWCRPVVTIQVSILPFMIVAFFHLHTLPMWMHASTVTAAFFGCAIVSGAAFGALVFFTSKNEGPPPYHAALSFLGFVVAILWIYATSEEIVNVILAFGMVFDVGHTVLGITILAVGIGMQDLVTNVGVAKAGLARMALSACIGAPLLNMCLGMGLSAIAGNAAVASPYPVPMTVHLFVCICFLVGSVILALVVLSFSDFSGGRFYGATMISVYVAFIIVSLFFEAYVDEDDWGFGLATHHGLS